MAKPLSKNSPVVRARAWTSGTTNPLTIYAEVKRGDYPVLGAKVEVSVVRPGLNGSNAHREKFDLLDTGSGGQYNLCFLFKIAIIRCQGKHDFFKPKTLVFTFY